MVAVLHKEVAVLHKELPVEEHHIQLEAVHILGNPRQEEGAAHILPQGPEDIHQPEVDIHHILPEEEHHNLDILRVEVVHSSVGEVVEDILQDHSEELGERERDKVIKRDRYYRQRDNS